MSETSILCFGDSNTYGFDPRPPLGGRYPKGRRWCDLLSARLSLPVINCGENGRRIPRDSWDLQVLAQAVNRFAPTLLTVMLGTNDVLLGGRADPVPIAARMEQLLLRIRERWPEQKLLLLTPPPVDLPEPELVQAVRRLGTLYREISRRHRIPFCDTRDWELSLCYDGAHLTEAGHQVFADRLADYLERSSLIG